MLVRGDVGGGWCGAGAGRVWGEAGVGRGRDEVGGWAGLPVTYIYDSELSVT